MKKNKKRHAFGQSIIKQFIRVLLKIHNLSYGLVGIFSQVIEQGRLHPKHRLTDYHHWFCAQLKPEWHVLDIGCGNGALAADLAKYCRSITGVDISRKNIEEAKKRLEGEFICADITTYPIEKKFDAVILSNVLEHINNRIDFLKKIRRYSNRFLIRVPMLDRDWITLYKQEIGVEYRLDPGHFIEYTLEGFIKELEEAGIELESYRIRYGEIYAVGIIKWQK